MSTRPDSGLGHSLVPPDLRRPKNPRTVSTEEVANPTGSRERVIDERSDPAVIFVTSAVHDDPAAKARQVRYAPATMAGPKAMCECRSARRAISRIAADEPAEDESGRQTDRGCPPVPPAEQRSEHAGQLHVAEPQPAGARRRAGPAAVNTATARPAAAARFGRVRTTGPSPLSRTSRATAVTRVGRQDQAIGQPSYAEIDVHEGESPEQRHQVDRLRPPAAPVD